MNVLEQAQEKLDDVIYRKTEVLSNLKEQKNKIEEQIAYITQTFDLSIESNQKIVDEIKLKFFS